ncbi:MAG: ComEA family DNA-binding protein [Bryobacteraceae bacterium]
MKSIRSILRYVCIASLLFSFALLCANLVTLANPNKQPPSHPVDLNVATLKELEELPGIGPVTAQRILDTRQKSGRFHRVEDLLAIRGISQKKLDVLRPYVVIGPPPSVAPAQKSNTPHGQTSK